MRRDYFAYLADRSIDSKTAISPPDSIVVKYFKENDRKSQALCRSEFIGNMTKQAFINNNICEMCLPDFSSLPSPDWFGIEVVFDFLTSWYSKDDCVFQVLDNPIRKDRIFGAPFLPASSWKGMLRWAFRMCTKDKYPSIEVHLFGNARGEQEEFRRGALAFYPTWFDQVDFEVINPHCRKTRAGTQPIYYEVVPGQRDGKRGATGRLLILYAPLPGMASGLSLRSVLSLLLEAIEVLLTIYGISAKRTTGWGAARITSWGISRMGQPIAVEKTRESLLSAIDPWLKTVGIS